VAAGSALNPRQMIQALSQGGTDLRAVVPDDALWACTTCRACVDACPMFIEHVDAVLEMRRHRTLELGETPRSSSYLEVMADAGTASPAGISARLDWASDLSLRRLAPGDSCETLLWVGDSGFLPQGRRTLRALVELLSRAGVDVAVLPEELDVGDVALRLGDEALFRDLAIANCARLDAVNFERVVTTDPHVLQALARDYSAVGRTFPAVHHTTLLQELIATGRISPAAGEVRKITYHDPCYLGRYAGEYEAPREILAALGAQLIEMPSNRRTSLCCGAGGGATITDVPVERRVAEIRIEQALATGAEVVATACPNCSVMFDGLGGERLAFADVAELLLAQTRGAQ
jgi:Fe-S oxidoreductase